MKSFQHILTLGLALGAATSAAIAQQRSAPASAASGVSTRASNRNAAQMVYQAQLALQRKDQDEAQKQLDSAKALNDEELRLWSTYGYLALARSDKPGAEVDFQKELTLHPKATEIYGALADLQEDLGQRAEEEATLTALLSAEPQAAGAAARLVHMLAEDGKPAEAVKLGQDFVAKFTEALKTVSRPNPRGADSVNYELSKAEMAAGMKDESAATTVALLKVTNSPTIQNDGAYRLAIAGVELPLAESSARSALLRAELDSRQVTLDSKQELQQQVRDGVVAVWDTLSWVLYREGKLDEAESFARSAWLQRQDLTIGGHLAEIEAAKGDKNMALTVCEVALAAPKPEATPPKPGVKIPEAKPGVVDVADLQARADTLRKGGAISKGRAGLDAFLTQPIALRGVSGRGDFILMMGFGIIELANPASKTNATGMLSNVLGAKVTGLWPKDSGARLIMNGTINCRPGGCSLQLHDPPDAPVFASPPVTR